MSRKHKKLQPLNQSDFKMKIIEDTMIITNGVRHAIFECTICKKHSNVKVSSVKMRGTSKCKTCANKENSKKCIKHELSHTRIHNIWSTMRQRCTNPKTKHYARYGGRGITVHTDWDDFLTFHKWSIGNGYNDKLTIDRINNDGNYEPSNCRWTTLSEQYHNKEQICNSTTGYIGVATNKKTYTCIITHEGVVVFRKGFKCKHEAANERNKFIIDNDLPHTLNVLHSTQTGLLETR